MPSPARKTRPVPKFTDVHGLLYTEDVDRIRAEAAATGEPWWPKLRRLVHEALQAKRVIR